MPHSAPFRQLVLGCVALVTLALVRWSVCQPTLYAQTSPLATPWPTLVVTYQPALPTTTPTLAPLATAVRVNFIFHSPLPTPTALPDFTPPQTTLQVTGTQTTTGWYRSPVSVTFRLADDFGAGVTQYQLDHASTWTDREYYYPPVTVLTDGVHTLTYRSLDRRHNAEAPQTTQIRIDRTPPQTDAPTVEGNQLPNGWYNTPVQVTLTGSDALSGLAGFAQQTANAAWVARPARTTLATTGQHTFTWRAVDNAGNGSAAQQAIVQVDLTPPTTTVTLDALPVNGWYTRPVSVTLQAVDEGAGVFQTQYRLPGEAGWRLYGGPFAVNAAGGQTVEYRSTDRALNTEPAHTLTLPLDLAPPVLNVRVSQPPATGHWYNGVITVTAAATDTEAGLAGLEVNLDETGWQPYTAPVALTPGTLHTLRFRATDQVGHSALSPLLPVGLDTQPPTTTVHLSQPPSPTGWFGAPVTVTCKARTRRPASCARSTA